MSPFEVKCEPQRVPFKYATNLQRPQNAGSCKKQESHGEKLLYLSLNALARRLLDSCTGCYT